MQISGEGLCHIEHKLHSCLELRGRSNIEKIVPRQGKHDSADEVRLITLAAKSVG